VRVDELVGDGSVEEGSDGEGRGVFEDMAHLMDQGEGVKG
jgi:hypothetical protein